MEAKKNLKTAKRKKEKKIEEEDFNEDEDSVEDIEYTYSKKEKKKLPYKVLQ